MVRVLILLLLLTHAAMGGTYTSSLNLYKPSVGEVGYGALTSANFQTIDNVGTVFGPVTCPAGAAVGDFVYIDGLSSVALSRADNATTAKVHGWIYQKITSTTARIQLAGRNQGVSALTPGTTYYLSAATAGKITSTAPTSPDYALPVGTAETATSLVFRTPVDAISVAGSSLDLQGAYDNGSSVGVIDLDVAGGIRVRDNGATTLFEVLDSTGETTVTTLVATGTVEAGVGQFDQVTDEAGTGPFSAFQGMNVPAGERILHQGTSGVQYAVGNDVTDGLWGTGTSVSVGLGGIAVFQGDATFGSINRAAQINNAVGSPGETQPDLSIISGATGTGQGATLQFNTSDLGSFRSLTTIKPTGSDAHDHFVFSGAIDPDEGTGQRGQSAAMLYLSTSYVSLPDGRPLGFGGAPNQLADATYQGEAGFSVLTIEKTTSGDIGDTLTFKGPADPDTPASVEMMRLSTVAVFSDQSFWRSFASGNKLVAGGGDTDVPDSAFQSGLFINQTGVGGANRTASVQGYAGASISSYAANWGMTISASGSIGTASWGGNEFVLRESGSGFADLSMVISGSNNRGPTLQLAGHGTRSWMSIVPIGDDPDAFLFSGQAEPNGSGNNEYNGAVGSMYITTSGPSIPDDKTLGFGGGSDLTGVAPYDYRGRVGQHFLTLGAETSGDVDDVLTFKGPADPDTGGSVEMMTLTTTGASIPVALTVASVNVVNGLDLHVPAADFFVPESASGTNWVTDVACALAADSNQDGETVCLFDDTTAEGAGFEFSTPAAVTNIYLTFWGRPEVAPGGAVGARLTVTCRDATAGSATSSWGTAQAVGAFSFGADEDWEQLSVTLTAASLGIAANSWVQCEFAREPTHGTDTLTGDLVVRGMRIGVR